MRATRRVAVPLQVYVCIYILVLYVLEKSEDAQIRCLLLLYSCLAWLTLSAVHAYAYLERVVSWARRTYTCSHTRSLLISTYMQAGN